MEQGGHIDNCFRRGQGAEKVSHVRSIWDAELQNPLKGADTLLISAELLRQSALRGENRGKKGFGSGWLQTAG
jgi:hypothetical protein